VAAALARVYHGQEAEQSIFNDRRYLRNRLVYWTVLKEACDRGLV